jgi:hypothetical protein
LYKSRDIPDDIDPILEDSDNPPPHHDSWQYLRFYPPPEKWVFWSDSYGRPLEVARWLNVQNLDMSHGTYQLRGNSLNFTLNEVKGEQNVNFHGLLRDGGLVVKQLTGYVSEEFPNPLDFDFISIPDIDHYYITTLKEKIEKNLPLQDFDQTNRAVFYFKKYYDEILECCSRYPTNIAQQVLQLIGRVVPVKGTNFNLLL